MPKAYWVYILASGRNGTLYVGVTNDLARRVQEHKTGLGATFVRKHAVHTLVWYEEYGDVNEAIAREKRLKRYNRAWKLDLIEALNPDWDDLYETLLA